MRKLVLWGHHADEYQAMFDLPSSFSKACILEYGCGPSAVNSDLSQQGQFIVSVDPLFNLDKDTLWCKVDLIFADMVLQIEKEQDKFDFSRYGSLANLIAKRKQGLAQFFADYDKGKKEKRYLGINDYSLPFDNFRFDFVLSAHYLFADGQDLDFHLQHIKELARVGKEVRIFPLIDRHQQPSPFLGPVLLGLQQDNFGVEVREGAFGLQRAGNALLRVFAQQCDL